MALVHQTTRPTDTSSTLPANPNADGSPIQSNGEARGVSTRTSSVTQQETILNETALNTELRDLAVDAMITLSRNSTSSSEAPAAIDGAAVAEHNQRIENYYRMAVGITNPHVHFLGEETAMSDPEARPVKIFSQDMLAVTEPIDGTRNLLAGNRWYACSMGIFEFNGAGFAPLHGSVVFPETGEHYYTQDGVVKLHNTASGEVLSVSPKAHKMPEIPRLAIYDDQLRLLNDVAAPDVNYHRDATSSSVSDLMRVVTGEIDGAVISSNFWDFAGAVPIMKALGVELYSLNSAQRVDAFGPQSFQLLGNSPWGLHEPLLACRPQDFHHISSLFR